MGARHSPSSALTSFAPVVVLPLWSFPSFLPFRPSSCRGAGLHLDAQDESDVCPAARSRRVRERDCYIGPSIKAATSSHPRLNNDGNVAVEF